LPSRSVRPSTGPHLRTLVAAGALAAGVLGATGCAGQDPVSAMQMKALEEATRRAAPLACPENGHRPGDRLRDDELVDCARNGVRSADRNRRELARLVRRGRKIVDDPKAFGEDAAQEATELTSRLRATTRQLATTTPERAGRAAADRVQRSADAVEEQARQKITDLVPQIP
jgi:hypothetical protein